MTLAQIVKPAEYRAICDVDIAQIRSLISAIGDDAWVAEDARKENRFACFHHTHHIIARFIPRNQDPQEFYSTPFWTVWQPLLTPILSTVAAHYKFQNVEFPKVMLARLAAGGVIDRHVDGAGSNLLTHKIHVPLVSNENVWFNVGDKSFQLHEGQAYELNNLKMHGVRNEGDSDRIHLIFEMFDQAAPSAMPIERRA